MRRSLRAFCRGWLTGGRSHVAPGGTPGPSRPFCRSGENLVMEGTRLAGNVSFKEPGSDSRRVSPAPLSGRAHLSSLASFHVCGCGAHCGAGAGWRGSHVGGDDERRGWDSSPRGIAPRTAFKAGPFGLSGTPPRTLAPGTAQR